MHFKAIEAHLKQNGRLPVNMKIILEGEEEVGSREPRQLRQGAQGRARRRRRRHLRLADVRSRHPVDLLRPARPRVLPDRSARHEERPAFRVVRRRRRQPEHGARADPRADEGSRRPHQDSRLLRRRAGADRGGARAVEAAAVQRDGAIAKELGAPKLFGESGYIDARARVGASDVRGQRPARRDSPAKARRP